MELYIQGPEPTGCLVSSSSEAAAGTTRMMARRSLIRPKLGTVVSMATVVSSLAEMEAKGASMGM